MYTEEQIASNKERFLSLVSSITRQGANISALVDKLENSDFFIAPATSKYHNNFKGGLCGHCLNVYDNLVSLVNVKCPGEYDEDTLKIVALFHDFSKMNYYKLDSKNIKFRTPLGKQTDEQGKFTWKAVPFYRIKDSLEEKVFLFGTPEENSFYMTETFIPLSADEGSAIINQNRLNSDGNVYLDSNNQYYIFNKYNIVNLLHCADVMASFMDEEIYVEPTSE